MNTLIYKITNFIEKKNLIPDASTIILGLSGGPDSVFLLHVLAEIQKENNSTLIAAHLNHEWRKEADVDAQLCKQLCQKLGIILLSKTISELNANLKFNGSKEETGRKARRIFFERIAREYGAHAIALAHHANDQQETFFIRLMRGASLTGLVGMKPQDGLYIRPLLGIKKVEILEYLNKNKIPYAMDVSNESKDYLRNRIRNSVIPALKLADDRFDSSFDAMHGQLQQTEEFLHKLAIKTYTEIKTTNGVEIQKLLALHAVLRTRVIILWLCEEKVYFIPSQGLFDEIVRFLEKPGSGTHDFYAKWQISKNKMSAKLIKFRE
jgi:tRNA(Ile)-lysidine synthase